MQYFRAHGFQTSLSAVEVANARLWRSEIVAFENHSFSTRAVLFSGSSSIARWSTLAQDFPDLPVVNCGFGGSQLSDSVYHFNAVFLPVAPRAVVFYAGDNDLAFGKKTSRLAQNFQMLADLMQVHLPKTPLFFISIKPSPARWNLIGKIRESNSLVHDICRRNAQLRFINMDLVMLTEDGDPRTDFYIEDGLHLSSAGYAAWSGVLRPLLAEFKDDKNSSASDN